MEKNWINADKFLLINMEYKKLLRIMVSLIMGVIIGIYISDNNINNIRVLQL